MRAVMAISLALIMAGCADAPAPADEETFQDFELEATDTTGVIRGVVVDTTITPVPEAKVTVVGQDLETVTDDAGRFGFEDLEAGVYFLQVQRPGYAKVQQSAEVVAGVAKPAIVRVLLEEAPGTTPVIITHEYIGYVGCSYKVANLVGGCNFLGLFGEEDSTIFIPLERRPDYYQNEIRWDSTQAAGNELVTIQWACAEGGGCNPNSNDDRTCNVRGPSPQVCKVYGDHGGGNSAYRGINGTRLGEDGRGLYARAYANCVNCVLNYGVGVMLEQKVEFYTNIFFNMVADEDWLFIRDGPHPVP